VDTAFSTESLDIFGVNDAEFKAKLVLHFGLPLHLQGRRADNEDRTGTMTDQEFLYHQSGLDGLAKTNVVGDQEVDTGHVNGSYERIELKILYRDTATERSLEK
jgi:hypothetical protein